MLPWLLRYRVEQSRRNSIFPRAHVLFSLSLDLKKGLNSKSQFYYLPTVLIWPLSTLPDFSCYSLTQYYKENASYSLNDMVFIYRYKRRPTQCITSLFLVSLFPFVGLRNKTFFYWNFPHLILGTRVLETNSTETRSKIFCTALD